MKGDRPKGPMRFGPTKPAPNPYAPSTGAARARLDSKTDEVDSPQAVAPSLPKGMTPRAPSTVAARSEADESDAMDARAAALAAAAELTAPLEARIVELEARLARFEAFAREQAADTLKVKQLVAAAAAPPALVASPAAPPVVAAAGIPIVFSQGPTPPPPAVAAAPSPPASVPAAAPLRPVQLEDVHVSASEVAMFDGGRRQRRITILFVLALLTLAGGLVAAMVFSNS